MTKKFFLVIVFFTVFFSGCGFLSDNNFPSSWVDDCYRNINNANVALWNSRITNPEIFSKLATRVAYTLEKEKNYEVTFLYEEESGDVRSLPAIGWYQRLMNKKEYREMLKADLTNFVLEELEEYDIESGRVVGVILKWHGRPFLGSTPEQFILCDLDGNGEWDYLTFGKGYFGETSDENFPQYVVNEFHQISFISDRDDLIELEGLSGGETVSYFEKIA